MGHDNSDGATPDFEPNRIPLGSKSKGKPSPQSHPTQRERKRKNSFLSVGITKWCKTAVYNYYHQKNKKNLALVTYITISTTNVHIHYDEI